MFNTETPTTRTNLGSAMGTTAIFVGGALAGAALGILMAPASGRDTRVRIRAKARQHADAVRHTAHDVADRSAHAVDAACKTAEAMVTSSRRSISNGKHRVEGAIEAGKETYRHYVSA